MAAWEMDQTGEVGDHMGQICEKNGGKEEAAHWYALALSGRRPETETRSRLAAIAGGDDKVDALVAKYGKDLEKERTLKLPGAAKEEGKADFFLLLGGTGSGALTVIDAKFVSGTAGLKGSVDALKNIKYSQKVPDETPVKILRRGTLSCSSGGKDCALVLALPEDVRSIE